MRALVGPALIGSKAGARPRHAWSTAVRQVLSLGPATVFPRAGPGCRVHSAGRRPVAAQQQTLRPRVRGGRKGWQREGQRARAADTAGTMPPAFVDRGDWRLNNCRGLQEKVQEPPGGPDQSCKQKVCHRRLYSSSSTPRPC